MSTDQPIQLTLFSEEETPTATAKTNTKINENDDSLTEDKHHINEEVYEPLDYQLADLFLKLYNKERNNKETDKDNLSTVEDNAIKTLKQSILTISKQTREGCIALHCSPQQQRDLSACNIIFNADISESNSAENTELANNFKPLVIENKYLYLRRYWQYQRQLAEQIQSRMNRLKLSSEQLKNQQKRLDYYFNEESLDTENKEVNWQLKAAQQALQNNFLIISGGPGTGKTTTITRILALLIEQYLNEEAQALNTTSLKKGGGGYKVLLAAPTGKASIRMLDSIRDAQQGMNLTDKIQQYLPTEASTIHKLLGYIPDSINFKYNRNNPLKADVVLIDEASMVDIAMMSKLVEAVPAHAKLILIGDKDQLASVETGSVFTDMCRGLEKTPYIVTLKKNWRFSKDSGIGKLAIAANNADQKSLFSVLKDQNQPECELLATSALSHKYIPEELISAWHSYFELINNPQASLDEIFEAFNQYRILCAQRNGLNGSIFISRKIENTLIKQGQISQSKRYFNQNSNQSWYHGRPIMITQNNYEKGLFNGDTGITLIKNGKAQIYFPDGAGEEEGNNCTTYKSFSPVRIPAHETTWAMTIHKSQGSEFNHVTLVLPQEIMPLLTRQLIYTGITRAKKSVGIIASEDVLAAGIKTNAKSATQIHQCMRTVI